MDFTEIVSNCIRSFRFFLFFLHLAGLELKLWLCLPTDFFPSNLSLIFKRNALATQNILFMIGYLDIFIDPHNLVNAANVLHMLTFPILDYSDVFNCCTKFIVTGTHQINISQYCVCHLLLIVDLIGSLR